MAQLLIVDALTSQPITGALVYVMMAAGQTPTSAPLVSTTVGVTLPAGAASATITASGYSSSTVSLPTGTVALHPTSRRTTVLSFTVLPNTDQTGSVPQAPTSAGAILAISANGQTEKLTVFADGSAQSIQTYAPGQYLVTVSSPHFNPLVQQITVSDTATSFLLTLTRTSSGQAPIAPTAPAASVAISSAIASLPVSDSPYEYVYPNSVDGKYFQAAQARMYIGNQFVDELNMCQWTAAQNRIPIFGYRSSLFDAVGRGRSLVQGQLAVNFISEGYMYILLQEFRKKIGSKLPAGQKNTTLSGIPTDLQTQINSVISARNRLLSAGAPSTTALDAQLKSLGATSPQALEYINSTLSTGVLDTSGSILGSNTRKHQNAIYLDIPFDIRVAFEGAGRTVNLTLKTCFLGANDFVFAQDGRTLLDTYSFIAREIA